MPANNRGMRHKSEVRLTLALLLSLVVGCGAAVEDEGYRDGRSEGGKANAGAGFTLDPACDYGCDEINGEESVCAQHCPDGCVTIELGGRWESDEAIDAAGSLSSFCSDDFPDEDLGRLTCELTYSIPSGQPSDCVAVFSEQACEAALDVCRDAF